MEYDCHSDIQFVTWHVQRWWQGFWKYITKWIQGMIWGLKGSYGAALACDVSNLTVSALQNVMTWSKKVMAQCNESKGNTPGVICDCIHVFTRSWLYLEAICAHMVHTGSSTSSARRNGIASLHLFLQYSLTLQWSLKLLQHLSAMDVTSLSSDSWPTVRILVMLPRQKSSGNNISISCPLSIITYKNST